MPITAATCQSRNHKYVATATTDAHIRPFSNPIMSGLEFLPVNLETNLGVFSWSFRQGDQSQEVQGVYAVEDNSLVLEPDCQLIYLAETDFARLDLYRNLAIALGLEPAFRRAALWRAIKARIQELADGRNVLPVWIIDEAQNLPVEFFRDFPAFLNFAFDSRDLMTVWLLGQPALAQTLDRAPYAAMASRIQVRLRLRPIAEREPFKRLIEHGLKQAGATHTLLSDSAMELLRQASQGLPRQAGRLIQTAMRLAVPKGLNHLPDELIHEAIEVLQ